MTKFNSSMMSRVAHERPENRYVLPDVDYLNKGKKTFP
jgi:hypothetical protein